MGAIVIPMHPFLVDISAGGLNHRTYLPVRPHITHRGKRTVAGTGAVVIPTHPFFVDASAGGLNHQTHLPVRPYILHRGNIPHRGKRTNAGNVIPDSRTCPYPRYTKEKRRNNDHPSFFRRFIKRA